MAYELLGPPRLSKLLYEAHLLEGCRGTVSAVLEAAPAELAAALEERIEADPPLRRRILSIGIPILLPDGERLLRGPLIKASSADDGWVDLTPANMRTWQERLSAMLEAVDAEQGDTSPRGGRWRDPGGGFFDPGEVAGWILLHEDGGERMKG